MAATQADLFVDPMAHQDIVGSTFAKNEHRPLVVIGKRSWNKWQLGRLGCPHPSAASAVMRTIQELRISTVQDFLDRVAEFGKFKGLGVTAYWTVLALARDLGADINHVHGDDRTFHTVHRSALKIQGQSPKKRKYARRQLPPSEQPTN